MKARGAAALLAGLGALLLAPSCTNELGAPGSGAPEGSGGSGGSAGRGALIRGATWSLTWDTARVTRIEGGGWSVDTDLGYRVHVTSGWLVDYSVSLGLCDSGGQGGGESALGRFFGVRSAYAHEDGDASTIDLQHAEDLTGSLEPRQPWSAAFPAARYCRVHWLAGRGDPRLETWWPQGYLVDLDAITASAAADDGEARVARITVKRSLGTLFDGIDLASATAEVLAGRVLENLALHVEAKVELWSLGGG